MPIMPFGTPVDDLSGADYTALVKAGMDRDRPTLEQALDSDDPVARALALGGLRRAGALSRAAIERALADPDRDVRCRAVELAIPFEAVALAPLLGDEDDLVVETAAWALGEREDRAPATLDRLIEVAQSHEVSICREAAVAALGAIGDPAGLETILAALDDRAPVRRRAVLALAPFDGPAVDTALQRALGDRDRQVRQAAEDLL